MPLLDRLFVVSDSGSGGGIGMGVILIVELLTYLCVLIIACFSSSMWALALNLVCRSWSFSSLGVWFWATFFFAEVGKTCYIYYSNI